MKCVALTLYNSNIVPIKKSKMIAKVQLPITGSGKVKRGQSVNIKLLNYDFSEHGMLKGIVGNISLVPQNNIYLIDVLHILL